MTETINLDTMELETLNLHCTTLKTLTFSDEFTL